jgi:hypothetical protein
MAFQVVAFLLALVLRAHTTLTFTVKMTIDYDCQKWTSGQTVMAIFTLASPPVSGSLDTDLASDFPGYYRYFYGFYEGGDYPAWASVQIDAATGSFFEWNYLDWAYYGSSGPVSELEMYVSADHGIGLTLTDGSTVQAIDIQGYMQAVPPEPVSGTEVPDANVMFLDYLKTYTLTVIHGERTSKIKTSQGSCFFSQVELTISDGTASVAGILTGALTMPPNGTSPLPVDGATGGASNSALLGLLALVAIPLICCPAVCFGAYMYHIDPRKFDIFQHKSEAVGYIVDESAKNAYTSAMPPGIPSSNSLGVAGAGTPRTV